MTQGIITNIDFYTRLSFNPLEHMNIFFASTQIILSVEFFGSAFYGFSLHFAGLSALFFLSSKTYNNHSPTLHL